VTTQSDLFAASLPTVEPKPPKARAPDEVVTYRGGGQNRAEKPPCPLVVVDPYPCDVPACRAHGTYGAKAGRWCYTHLPADFWTK
jgi:hypothetical protein